MKMWVKEAVCPLPVNNIVICGTVDINPPPPHSFLINPCLSVCLSARLSFSEVTRTEITSSADLPPSSDAQATGDVGVVALLPIRQADFASNH